MSATASLTALDTAIDRGTRRLLELQRPGGIWVGELESNVTMTAQHLFWNHVLGLRTPDLDRRIANELMARMRDDGTWSIWFEGPADLSTSIEAYVALRMAGADPGPRALDYIRREGGIPKARLFTKCFLALLGQWPWQRMVRIPPPWVWGIIALSALGNGFEDDTLRNAVEGWRNFMVEDGDRLRPEACQSPVWDTGLAVLALRACGVPADHPQLVRAGEYLLSQEVRVRGDWAVRKPDLAPGGWAFEYENDLYPDVD